MVHVSERLAMLRKIALIFTQTNGVFALSSSPPSCECICVSVRVWEPICGSFILMLMLPILKRHSLHEPNYWSSLHNWQNPIWKCIALVSTHQNALQNLSPIFKFLFKFFPVFGDNIDVVQTQTCLILTCLQEFINSCNLCNCVFHVFLECILKSLREIWGQHLFSSSLSYTKII